MFPSPRQRTTGQDHRHHPGREVGAAGIEPAVVRGRQVYSLPASAVCIDARSAGRIRTGDLRLMRPAGTTELPYRAAPSTGLEPATSRSVGGRSVQLSYKGLVRVERLELPVSCSQSRRPPYWPTPGRPVFSSTWTSLDMYPGTGRSGSSNALGHGIGWLAWSSKFHRLPSFRPSTGPSTVRIAGAHRASWSPRLELNQRPHPYQGCALPSELRGRAPARYCWAGTTRSRLDGRVGFRIVVAHHCCTLARAGRRRWRGPAHAGFLP